MRGLLQDLRYALRALRKSHAFTLTAVLTLALGIGANVAIFSMVNGIIVRPLPVAQPQQLVVLAEQQQGAPLGVYYFSYPELVDFRKQADVFSDLFAYEIGFEGMSANNRADRFMASHVSGNYFSALGLKPALGRLFLPREGETPGSPALAVLGFSYWQNRFSGNPDVIGKQVLVDGKPATVIGVAPKNFHGTSFALNMDGYLPLSMAATDDPEMWTSRTDRRWIVMGRLKPGISLAQAQASSRLVAERLAQQYPATDKGITVDVFPERLSRPLPLPNNLIAIIAGLFLFLAGVILLLACVNVANILLVRTTKREGEMAIRAALGASRARLISQVLSESIWLAILGAAGGVALGIGASHWISDLRLTSVVPVSLDFGLDWRVIAYAAGTAVFAVAIAGLWPALRVTRSDINEVLREGGRTGSGGASRHRTRNILVAGQMAGSLMLLIIAGLFVRSLQSAQHMYLGFDPDHLLNLVLDPHEVGYGEARTTNVYRELQARVRSLPGVQSTTVAYSVPMGNYSDLAGITIEGHPTPVGQQRPIVEFNSVDSDYFHTLKISLLRGRAFVDSDDQTAVKVAIVNQTMAERFWPKEDPIGKRFTTDETKGTWWQVVGVAQDGKYTMLMEDTQPYFYVPLAQHFTSMRALQIRTSIAPESLISQVRQVVRDLDPELPIFSLRTSNDALNGANGFMIFRIGALLASCIGAMGLVLAVVGVYGVVAFAAAQRTREIGIRMALGADRAQVLKLIVGQGLWVVLAGAFIGLLATFAISREVANLLIGVSASDPVTFAAATLILLAAAIGACYIPARRAMKLNPMVALHYE